MSSEHDEGLYVEEPDPRGNRSLRPAVVRGEVVPGEHDYSNLVPSEPPEIVNKGFPRGIPVQGSSTWFEVGEDEGPARVLSDNEHDDILRRYRRGRYRSED